MNTHIVLTMLATLTIGGAAGAGVTCLVTTAQVTCPSTAEANPANDGMRKFLESKPIPTTGYKSY